MTWTLWSMDYFDREAEPIEEASGNNLDEGLILLWRKTLEEGLLDDGRPTFSWFTLHIPGPRSLALPRDPLDNPALAKLRCWRGTPGFIERLGRWHGDQPDEARARLALQDAQECPTAEAFCRRLGLPER